MPNFPIVDSHVHLYDPNRLRFSWMDGIAVLQGAHLVPDFDTAIAPVEVESLVFVEVGADPDQHLEEAAWVAGLAAGEPRLKGIVAAAPLERGEAVEADLVRLTEHTPLKGIRRLLQGEADPAFCLQPAFVRAVQLLAKFDLGFDLCLYHHQLPAVIELVRSCPEVRFVLDHIGKPGIKAGLIEPWRSRIRELASLPNVACKLSGVITEADHAAWTSTQLLPYIRHAIDCFGLDRVMFGGDWPVSEQTHHYAQWVGIVEEALAGCSADELRAVFCHNAETFYRL